MRRRMGRDDREGEPLLHAESAQTDASSSDGGREWLADEIKEILSDYNSDADMVCQKIISVCEVFCDPDSNADPDDIVYDQDDDAPERRPNGGTNVLATDAVSVAFPSDRIAAGIRRMKIA